MELNKELLLNLFGPEDYENRWVLDLPEEDYHKRKTEINSSSLKWMLDSPNAFYRCFVQNYKKKQTESMNYGKLCHMAILEGKRFQERHIVIPDFGDLRKTINKQGKTAFVEEKLALYPDAVFLDEDDFDTIMSSIDALLSHTHASKLLSNGAPEVTGFYRDPITGLLLRSRIDFLSYNLNCQVDIKTTRETRWESFRRSFEGLRYDFQMAMYDESIFQINKTKPNHTVNITIDNQFPYEVEVYEIDEEYKLTGAYEYRNALDKLKIAIDTMSFPRKNKEIIFTEMSPWMRQRYQLLGVI